MERELQFKQLRAKSKTEKEIYEAQEQLKIQKNDVEIFKENQLIKQQKEAAKSKLDIY